jgi:organic radical activating enzyme
MTLPNKKTFCIQPFREVAMKNWGDSLLNEAWPCCVMGNYSYTRHEHVLKIDNIENLTPQEIFDHPRMQELRDNLSNGVRDPACRVCWDMEDKDIKSHREFFNQEHGIKEDTNIVAKLSDIDITTSNTCNLRCRMCRPSASSSLYVDFKYFKKENRLSDVYIATSKFFTANEHPINSSDSKQMQWIYDNTDKITKIKASGGEPFYDKKVIQLLKKYIEDDTAKNTELSFHTNGTQFNDNIISLITQFKSNSHTISIDGVGKIYDYVRYPFKFTELEDSLKNYIKKVNPHLKINLTVNAYNILNIKDFIDWAMSITNEKCNIAFSETYPLDRGISLQHLPLNILIEVRKQIQLFLCQKDIDMYPWSSHLEKLINMINSVIIDNKENRALMKREILLFDQARNQNYRDYLDERLVKWLDD